MIADAPAFTEAVFAKCGYACTFVADGELRRNTGMYLQTLMAYIDRGVSVITWGRGGPPAGVYMGYEEHGRTLLYITGDSNEPRRVPLERALLIGGDMPANGLPDGGHTHGGTDLEALGGGFNVTLAVLRDKARRGKIVAKLREFADVTDEITRVLNDNLERLRIAGEARNTN